MYVTVILPHTWARARARFRGAFQRAGGITNMRVGRIEKRAYYQQATLRAPLPCLLRRMLQQPREAVLRDETTEKSARVQMQGDAAPVAAGST